MEDEPRCTDLPEDTYCLGQVEAVHKGRAFTCIRCGTTWDAEVLKEQWEAFKYEHPDWREKGDR